MVRKGLGRGLSTLLGERPSSVFSMDHSKKVETEEEIIPKNLLDIAPERIDPNPYQPRTEFEPEALQELVESIRQHGLLEPLLVRRDVPAPGRFQLIAGERRLKAALLAGLSVVPVLVRDTDEQEMLEIAIVENVQRENLSAIEEARAYRRLMDGVVDGASGLTQQEVAARVGKSRTVVANLLRLLDLPEQVQSSIQEGLLSVGHGKILAGLEPDLCLEAWSFSIQNKASVRDLERFLEDKKAAQRSPEPDRDPVSEATRKSRVSNKGESQDQAGLDIHWKSIQEALQERLRTKVSVHHKKDDSGTIEVHFFNQDDLDRLLESLGIEL
ncbi:MAG: ParB/RepB/Spo0J family partition protein [Candidatus Omnitrophica bacterium]|nr:ParB/RepB/Spo0J family partition protein [Candidatus Omnitrophota bacterium]